MRRKHEIDTDSESIRASTTFTREYLFILPMGCITHITVCTGHGMGRAMKTKTDLQNGADSKAEKGAPNTLVVTTMDGKSRERTMAELGLSSLAGNAQIARIFAEPTFGELEISDAVGALRDEVKNVGGGNLSGMEAVLVAQVVVLDKIFNELARRSAANMGRCMDATEKYMRLALKAQGQCRATVQALGELKNPPVVYARQANITSGPQQVNNGVAVQCAHAHAGENKIQQNELLEAKSHERLDGRAASATGRINQTVATVGAIDGAAD